MMLLLPVIVSGLISQSVIVGSVSVLMQGIDPDAYILGAIVIVERLASDRDVEIADLSPRRRYCCSH